MATRATWDWGPWGWANKMFRVTQICGGLILFYSGGVFWYPFLMPSICCSPPAQSTPLLYMDISQTLRFCGPHCADFCTLAPTTIALGPKHCSFNPYLVLWPPHQAPAPVGSQLPSLLRHPGSISICWLLARSQPLAAARASGSA